MSMNIAVFADIHGRVLLAFTLCARWERETGEKIDLILQAGDLGAFPNADALDRATRSHAKADPSELGFMTDFGAYDATVAATLAQTTCPMLCVRGNHEDHVWLDGLEERSASPIFSIDPYQRIWMLKTGVPYTLHVKQWQGQSADSERNNSAQAPSGSAEDDSAGLSIIGVGRIGAPTDFFAAERSMGQHGGSRLDAGHWRKNDPDPRGRRNRYIAPEESARIQALRLRSCNVLLTHDCARDAMAPGSGSDDIGWLLQETRPRYHFFGHYGGPCMTRTDRNGATYVCKLADLHWNPSDYGQRLEDGSMGMLRWNSADDHTFEVVGAPWLREYTARSWRYL